MGRRWALDVATAATGSEDGALRNRLVMPPAPGALGCALARAGHLFL